MSKIDLIDMSVLLFVSLVMNMFFPAAPFTGVIRPDFLLALIALIVILKKDIRIMLIGSVVAALFLAFNRTYASGNPGVLVILLLIALSMFFIGIPIRAHVKNLSIWCWISGMLITVAVVGVGSLLTKEVLTQLMWKRLMMFSLLNGAMTYVFYVTLSFSERVFSAQFRNI